MPKLTVLIPCFNNESIIRPCLESVAWADEIFVVDSGSTDRTLEIAREFGARIVVHEYVNSATQKNWAIPQASHEWVMVIDTDERATPELQQEIKALMAGSPGHDGYRIYRENYFFGHPIRHSGWDSDNVLRLFKRDISRYLELNVHADVEVQGGNIGWLSGKFQHYTYTSFAQYLEKFGRYTTWSSRDLRKKGRHASAWNLVMRPSFRFFRHFILKQGFRDGVPGLLLSGLAAMSVFMKYAKLWEMEQTGLAEGQNNSSINADLEDRLK